MNNPGFSDYSLLVLLSAIFAAAFLLIEISIETVPVLSVVAIRLALAAAMFYCICRFVDQRLPMLGWRWLMVGATALFGNTLPFFLITWGQQEVDSGLAAILVSVMPLFTIVLAHIFTSDEKLNRYKVAGVMLGLMGIVYLFGVDRLGSLGDNTLHQYALLGAAGCYAVNVIIMKSLTGLPRYALISAVLGVSFVMILPFALVIDGVQDIQPSLRSIIAIVLLSTFASAGGNFLRFALIERQGVSFLSQINYLIPIIAVGLAWLFLGHVPQMKAYVAMGMILLGIAIVSLGKTTLRPVKGATADLKAPRS